MDLNDMFFPPSPRSNRGSDPVAEQQPGIASSEAHSVPTAAYPALQTPTAAYPALQTENGTENTGALPEPAAPCAGASTGNAGRIALAVSALSDTGCVRTNNEDSFGYAEPHGVYLVCDGMGGMASGEIASACSVKTVLETFAASAGSDLPVSTRLMEAIVAANRAVWQQAQEQPEHKGMGTTIVAAALDGEKLIVGNVGDSRAYVVEAGRCVQLTIDHSYINELIRNGTLTVEDARNADLNGMESVITRAIGAQADVRPDFFSVDLRPGTTALLATDGLTRYLLQDEIALVLINTPFEAICSTLIRTAKERGGQDNITCLLLKAI